MDWKRLLSYIFGFINEAILSRNEYLVAENRILKGQIKDRIFLSDAERKTLAEIGKRLGKKALEEIATHRETGDHPVLASSMDRPEVRLSRRTNLSWPAPDRSESGEIDRSDSTGES